MLSTTTIDKFVRESFISKEFIVVKPDETAALTDQIRQKLSGFSSVSFPGQPRFVNNPALKVMLDIELMNPVKNRYYQNSNDFRLVCTHDGRLRLTDHYRLWVDVPNVDELIEFVRRCHERLLRQQLQETKRNKVRALHTQGVLAQVKAIAKQDEFDFYLDEGRYFVDLLVRLEKNVALQIRLNYKQLEKQLPHVRAVINDVLNWTRKGVRFRTVRVGSYFDDKWISHHSL